MKVEEKERARKLRKKGLSMNQIIELTGFSKASVSFWTRDIVLTAEQRLKLSGRGRSMDSIEKRRASRLKNISIKREAIVSKAKKDFSSITSRELKIIGAMLYWGEGRKAGNWSVSVANSDPLLIKVIMRFFREICNVPEEKFRAQIHIFEGANIKKSEEYWSKITNIPRKQFIKTYSKPNKSSLQKRKTLPYGTIDVYIHDTKLFLTIKGWIEKITELTINL